MDNSKSDKSSKKADRLAAIEMADDRTSRPKREIDRDVGAETPGDPGASGAPQGDGNTIRSRDADVPLVSRSDQD